MNELESTKDLVVFESKDGEAHLEVTTDYDTVWLNQAQLVELFQRDKSVISRHISNIFKEGELEKESVVAKFATVQFEGEREVQRDIEYYNLDVVISVGYRVKSQRGVEFRQWATKVLKQYLIDGYALNEARLKNAPGSLLDLFKLQVQLWERQELINTEIQDDIQKLGDKIISIEAKIKSVDEGYYTIAGYCSLYKIPCPLHKAKEWGKAATALSRQKNIPTGTAHDERFGKVRTYHEDVLKEVIK
ncbi:MAG: virulence RhuM family protein [Saprospiraceae bacterium]|nr:virulence RhuM family protein [Saprospiraceae bacterium]